MAKDKKSFFERLTGSVSIDDYDTPVMANNVSMEEQAYTSDPSTVASPQELHEEDQGEGQLSIDVFQTPDEIIIKTMVAGVHPDHLDISITRDMVTIRGDRQESHTVERDHYFHRELYWGSFSRTILLPQEIEVEDAEAIADHGLLTLRLPKINKARQTKLKVKSK